MILTIEALLPAIILIIFVFREDKVEKEPITLLIKLFFLGALSTIPAVIFETVLEGIFSIFLVPDTLLFYLVDAFLVVAVSEEFCKRQAVKIGAWHHPAFNYRFDAVVYCVTAAMGFAGLENLLYVFEDPSLVVSRGLLAIPGHAVDGAFMGIYLGEAKLWESYGNRTMAKKYMRKSLLVPMLLHGFYDFCLFTGNGLMILLFFIFVVVIDILAIRRIRRAERDDRPMA